MLVEHRTRGWSVKEKYLTTAIKAMEEHLDYFEMHLGKPSWMTGPVWTENFASLSFLQFIQGLWMLDADKGYT